MQRLRQRLGEVVSEQARVHGCSGSIDFREELEPYFPPLVNNPEMAAFAK